MVIGPFKINGVPLRRVNQAYVIATSTKVNLSGVNLNLDKFNDAYFARPVQSRKQKEEFFAKKDEVRVKNKLFLLYSEQQ
jgi:large subunit ribosomal protein L6e